MKQGGYKKWSCVEFQLLWATNPCHDTEIWATTHPRQSYAWCVLSNDQLLLVRSVLLYQPWPQGQSTVPGNFIYRHSKLFWFFFASGWTLELYSSRSQGKVRPIVTNFIYTNNGNWINIINNYRYKYWPHAVRGSSIRKRQMKNQRKRISWKQWPLITEHSVTRFSLTCILYFLNGNSPWIVTKNVADKFEHNTHFKKRKMLTVQVTKLHTILLFM